MIIIMNQLIMELIISARNVIQIVWNVQVQVVVSVPLVLNLYLHMNISFFWVDPKECAVVLAQLIIIIQKSKQLSFTVKVVMLPVSDALNSSASDCTYCNKNKTSNEYFFLVSGSQGMCSSLCPENYYYPYDQTTQYYCKSCW